MSIESIKSNITRRIAIRTVLFGVWIAGITGLLISKQDLGLQDNTFLYMIFALVAVWVIQLIRDVKRLRNQEYLKAAATFETDERNILITYKATRLAAVICLSLVPIAMCVFAFLDMVLVVDALAGAVGVFAIIYLICWKVMDKLN